MVRRRQFEFPRRIPLAESASVSFPIGGIGTGTISLGGRGQLRDWEIFSRPDKGRNPNHSLAMIWVKPHKGQPQTRVIEGCLTPPFEKARGLGRDNLPGLPRFRDTVFEAVYPFARVDFRQPHFPVTVSLEAFNPMIPLDVENSSLPLAVLRYHIQNTTDQKVSCGLCYSLSNFNTEEVPCRENTRRTSKSLVAVQLNYSDNDFGYGVNGNLCIATDGPGRSALANWDNSEDRNELQSFWDVFSQTGRLPRQKPVFTSPIASVASSVTLKPGEKRHICFYITWWFPQRTIAGCGWELMGHEADKYAKTDIGNFYATRYKDSWDAIQKIVPRINSLEKQSRCFTTSLTESTLPGPVLDALTANMSTLRSQTMFRTSDGHFHGFEGCDDQKGCCPGDCNHVYNYEVATGMLFPPIQQSLLRTAFFTNTDNNGVNSFRTQLPEQGKRLNKVAADGTMGCIARLYRHWQLHHDMDELREYWPRVNKIFAFTWRQHSWDGDGDGVMEGAQHNTYDCEFYGPNPLCGVWYLAALKAAQKMAEALADNAFANKCAKLFDRGSQWIDDNLFNGEYYYQQVRAMTQDKIDPVFESRSGARNRQKPYHQIENGCLIDQLAGQYFANLCGLGHLLDKKNIRRALRSVMKYNFKKPLYEQASTQRIYALNDESGLVICSYPRSDRPEIPMPYIDEFMTGFEYQAAAHMIYEGRVGDGLKVVESIRRRYDGVRRSPWNEAECGHHYARAMASWSLLPALSGFAYSAVENSIGFSPKINRDDFQSFFVTPTCWGTYRQFRTDKFDNYELKILYGKLRLELIYLPRRYNPSHLKQVRINAHLAPKAVVAGNRVAVATLRIKAQDTLRIKFSRKQPNALQQG